MTPAELARFASSSDSDVHQLHTLSGPRPMLHYADVGLTCGLPAGISAIQELNSSLLLSRHIIVQLNEFPIWDGVSLMPSRPATGHRRHIIIDNLPNVPALDELSLADSFDDKSWGKVVAAKILRPSKAYSAHVAGWVEFEEPEQADRAAQKVCPCSPSLLVSDHNDNGLNFMWSLSARS